MTPIDPLVRQLLFSLDFMVVQGFLIYIQSKYEVFVMP